MKKVLEDLACNDMELSILFTSDDKIAQMNEQYLGRIGPTNVLAFPMIGGSAPEVASGMMGDVVISVDTALRESEEQGETLTQTIERLLIHGILHLIGYDHEKSAVEADRMQREEERLMAMIG